MLPSGEVVRGKSDHASQAAAIARIVEVAPHAAALRAHLILVLASPAFKGSKRSQEFLRYIVEHSLAGQFDQLKERTLGMELFGRPATYDTGEDSIVRVSASDVRRRLLQYYSEAGSDSEFRIELPSGSYIPEFRHRGATGEPLGPIPASPIAAPAPKAVAGARVPWRRVLPYGMAAVFLAGCLLLWFQNQSLRQGAAGGAHSPARILPWSAIFEKDSRTRVIVSDTAFGAIQDLTGVRIPLPDYANRKYPPENANPDVAQAVRLLLRRQFTAVPDVDIAVRVSELAQASGNRISVGSARTLQIQDFKTDDNFILLGSVATNPWSALFDSQMDFVVEYDAALKKTVCRNRHPRAGEEESYIPTAVSFDTGDAYAVVALLTNPGQAGHILLLAGTSGEATEMAGKFVTNLEDLSQALKRAGINPTGPVRNFQALLRLKAMAGSARDYEVLAVHPLSPPAAR